VCSILKKLCKEKTSGGSPALKITHSNAKGLHQPAYLPFMFLNMPRLVVFLFVVLLGGAIYFSLERILFCDASFMLMRIVNYGSLQIQEHRYGSFITQAFPLIGSRLGFSLQTLVILYSASFNIFYLSVALLLIYKFRETGLALLMAFYFLLFSTDSFFWTNNEVHQGIAWMFLFFGTISWMKRQKVSRFIYIPAFILLSFISLFTHPLVVFPFVFLWIVSILEKKWTFNKFEILGYSLLIAMICYLKYHLSTTEATSFYDVEKLQHTKHISMQKLSAAFSSPLAKEIAIKMITDYWMVTALFVAGIVSAARQKKFLVLALTTIFTTVYFAAIFLTFSDFLRFYMESELMPLSILATTPFVLYVIPRMKAKLSLTITGGIFLARLATIGMASEVWTDRKDWIMGTLDEMRAKNIPKAIIYENELNKKILIMNWGIPAESMVASALRGDKPQLTFVVGEPGQIKARLPHTERQMIGSFENFYNWQLNQRYFLFDTTSSYRILE
jgi:hypothetical protein